MFGGDTLTCIDFKALSENGYDTIIECGTEIGVTTEWLSSIFDIVYTIEIKADNYYRSAERLLKYQNVFFLYGDCSIHLNNILPLIPCKVILFIDLGNYMAVQKTLESIIRAINNGHEFDICLAIRGIESNSLNYYFSFANIKRFIDIIYPFGYEINFNTQAEGERMGMCYIWKK